MFKEVGVLVLFYLALAASEPRRQQRLGSAKSNDPESPNQPQFYSRIPGGRRGSLLKVLKSDEDYNDNDVHIDEDYEENLKEERNVRLAHSTFSTDENEPEENDNNMPINKIKMFHFISMRRDEIKDNRELEETENLKNKLRDSSNGLKSNLTIQLEAYIAVNTETGELALVVPLGEVLDNDAEDSGNLVQNSHAHNDSQARAMKVIVRRRRRNGGQRINANSLNNILNIPRPNFSNQRRRVRPNNNNNNNNVRIIRQYVNGRPISVQNTNRLRPVQANNRQRLNIN